MKKNTKRNTKNTKTSGRKTNLIKARAPIVGGEEKIDPSLVLRSPSKNHDLNITRRYLLGLDQEANETEVDLSQAMLEETVSPQQKSNKIFKADIHITHMIELPGVEKFAIPLPQNILVIAKDKEDCVNKVTARIDRYKKKSSDLAHPYKTRVIIVAEIAIHELEQYTSNRETWSTFFRWQAGGNYLTIYHAPFLKSKYREHRNDKGEFSNLD